jgi:hypothetical protein
MPVEIIGEASRLAAFTLRPQGALQLGDEFLGLFLGIIFDFMGPKAEQPRQDVGAAIGASEARRLGGRNGRLARFDGRYHAGNPC